MEKVISYCCSEILKIKKQTPVLVAVTGDSGSGKSFFCKLIVDRLKMLGVEPTLINHDEFLISRKDREPMKKKYYKDGPHQGKTYWEVLENMFRLDEYRTIIDSLKRGLPVAFYPYQRSTGTISNIKRIVEPSSYILVDTSMLHELADIVILIDVSQEIIIERKLKRDADVRTPEQIVEMHQKVQGYYWLDRGCPKKPDITIDNNNFDAVRVK